MAISKKLYLGYDLGDGETQISLLSPEQDFPSPLEMPTTKGKNEPIVTAYGVNLVEKRILLGNDLLGEEAIKIDKYYANFKVKPTEAIKVLPEDAQVNILKMCKAREPNTKGIIALLKRYENSQMIMAKCVREFTNSIFMHEKIASFIISYWDKIDDRDKSDENKRGVEVFIGHPTKWNRDDVLIYKAMLEDSILGKREFVYHGCRIPLNFDVAPESRAAFLYGRRKYASDSNGRWKIDKYTLVIDVGSSTVDITAMSGLEPDNAYDEGHPFLGARLIDKAIYKYYRKELQENGRLSTLDRILKENDTAEILYILACRKGKEEYFSYNAFLRVGSPYVDVGDLRKPRQEMNSILATSLTELDNKVQWANGRSWEHEFESFLAKQKTALERKKKNIDRIILTGGASRMEFVKETCKRVFGKVMFGKVIIYTDDDPGVAISHGLALVGRSNEISEEFNLEAESFLRHDLSELVRRKVPILAEQLSETIASIILDDIAFPELLKWKSRLYITLNGAIAEIKNQCTDESKLKAKLSSDPVYQEKLKHWIEKDLIEEINKKLLDLCQKYKLSDFKTKDVDITTVSIDSEQIAEMSGVEKAICDNILEPLDNVVLTTMIVLTTVVVTILLAVPGPGWLLLAMLAGVSVPTIVIMGWESMREKISRSMMSYDLPKWVRNRVSEYQIESALNDSKYDVQSKIESELKSTKTSTEIAEDVADLLSPQIKQKIHEIRCIIETKSGKTSHTSRTEPTLSGAKNLLGTLWDTVFSR